MKDLKIIFAFITISFLLMGCTQQQKKVNIEDYLKEKFNCLSVQSAVLDAPPILGGNQTSYYCSFKDKEMNDCYLIIDPTSKDYILIYENSVVDSEKSKITDKYKDLFDSILNPTDLPELEYKTKSTLENVKILKAKSNIDMFKDGSVGVMQITKKFIYNDENIGKVVGPSEASVVVLFDTTTKQYYQYDVGSKPRFINK